MSPTSISRWLRKYDSMSNLFVPDKEDVKNYNNQLIGKMIDVGKMPYVLHALGGCSGHVYVKTACLSSLPLHVMTMLPYMLADPYAVFLDEQASDVTFRICSNLGREEGTSMLSIFASISATGMMIIRKVGKDELSKLTSLKELGYCLYCRSEEEKHEFGLDAVKTKKDLITEYCIDEGGKKGRERKITHGSNSHTRSHMYRP